MVCVGILIVVNKQITQTHLNSRQNKCKIPLAIVARHAYNKTTEIKQRESDQ